MILMHMTIITGKIKCTVSLLSISFCFIRTLATFLLTQDKDIVHHDQREHEEFADNSAEDQTEDEQENHSEEDNSIENALDDKKDDHPVEIEDDGNMIVYVLIAGIFKMR